VKEYITSILFASSKSHSLIVPLAAPAATRTSEESKLTESIPLVCPDKLCMKYWVRQNENHQTRESRKKMVKRNDERN
jgi:hypothetical protein